MVYITKLIEFCASHRLFNPELDDETNWRIFGPCSNPNGHGHNYRLEVTVKGVPDSRTGMVLNLKELKQIVQERVIDHLDHKNLDKDVPFLAGRITTAENIATAIWRRLDGALPHGTLHRVRLFETSTNFVDYFGEEGSGGPAPAGEASEGERVIRT